MKTELILLLTAAALIPLSTVAQDAAAEDIHIQASFYPYYDFTRNVAVSPDNVDLFLPLGVAAHDWEPGISKVESLEETDVFVYNGLGIEEYLERLVESDDYDHITFVQASVGLDLISTTGLDEMIRGALEEYESGHYTTEEAVEAIKAILDTEEIREILVMYRSGDLTTTEALSRIQSLSGGGHARTTTTATMNTTRWRNPATMNTTRWRNPVMTTTATMTTTRWRNPVMTTTATMTTTRWRNPATMNTAMTTTKGSSQTYAEYWRR